MLRWGVIGAGRAGRARGRAIQACARSRLVAVRRGDVAALGLEDAGSVAAVLAAVDAVAICSPSGTHPALVRQGLEAGCHVVCEYPLARSRSEAEALLALAGDRGRVLHVEHIELLAASQVVLRDQLRGVPIRSGVIADWFHPSEGGSPRPVLSRLHRVIDLFGLPDRVALGVLCWDGAVVVGREREAVPDFVGTGSWLELVAGAATLRLEQRQVTLDGQVLELPEVGGLFSRDQACAVARILDGEAPYVADDRIAEVLGVAEIFAPAEIG